ncbi:hypothetical protein EDD11_000714 [Mortierella claussenii]|nr:hypothetical protein EDD11_000714 [Mortierella claussenii]
MRPPQYCHTLLAVAIIAFAAISLSILEIQALPAGHVHKRGIHDLALAAPAPTHAPTEPVPTVRPKPLVPTSDPITTNDPQPSPTQRPEPPAKPSSSSSSPPSIPPPASPPSPPPSQPKPSNTNPPPPQHSAAPSTSKPSNTHSDTETSSGSVTLASTSGTGSTAEPTRSVAPDDGSDVPTKVSEKVLIGLGTVGGLLVFALGGLAFCRHRRKKNLAIALLEQTAQFNHNNPYAKLSEAGKLAKDSLAMTPTKPIGTYSVVAVYTPALADEIEIGLGESVTILQEYDDGWCLGVNNSRNGIQGVFPRHCLEGYYDRSQYGSGGGPGYYPPNPNFKAMASKRMSSIPAGGWNNAPPVYNGGNYGDYPPNPSIQYNDGQGYYNNHY